MGEGRTLSAAEEATVQRLFQDHFPDELNIDSALWTRSAVQTLIACQCEVEMPIRTVGEYLKRWGILHKNRSNAPMSKTHKRLKSGWKLSILPLSNARAQEDAEIAWGDESGLRSDAGVGRGYAPIGQTPEIRLSTQRVSVNYIASISNQGKVRFMKAFFG